MGNISTFIACISAEIGIVPCYEPYCEIDGHPVIIFNKNQECEVAIGFEDIEAIETFSNAVSFFAAENSIDRDIDKGIS